MGRTWPSRIVNRTGGPDRIGNGWACWLSLMVARFGYRNLLNKGLLNGITEKL